MTQVSDAPARTRAQIAEKTLRKDPWWRQPAIVSTLLTIWVLYATVRVFMGHYYWVARYHYLTPFYSPCVSGECVPGSSALGHWIPAVPPIIPYAFVALVFVLGFRLTCYYYRRAYYRAFWRAPAACAVREPHAKYTGETRFPLIIQNTHRYFFYIAGIISLINTYDAVMAMQSPTGFGFVRFASKCSGEPGAIVVIRKLSMSNSSGSLPGFKVFTISCALSHTNRSTTISILPPFGSILAISPRCSRGGRFNCNPFT